ncbi:MAG: hypothetical protein IPM08_04745 [Actinomycetales bacterium]|nr:hypothetical protein [Actinomycetales bacterium]
MLIRVAPDDLTGTATGLLADRDRLLAAAAALRGAHGDAVHTGDSAALLDVLTQALETATVAALTLAEAAGVLGSGLASAGAAYASTDSAVALALGGVR